MTDLLDIWAAGGLGHGYHARDGWPWPWPDSRHTDLVYKFDSGRVWIPAGRASLPAGAPVVGENGSARR